MECRIARLLLDSGKSHSMELPRKFFFRRWEVPFYGATSQVFFRRWEVPFYGATSQVFFRRWEVPTCIFSTVAFNTILGFISTLILFLKLRRLILSLE